MHTNALHLRVSVFGFSISKVLIDGGASVNVCPLRTIQEIGIRRNQIEPSIIDITRFDGHSQTPLGKVILSVSIIRQDVDHKIEFHVIDVDTSYNLLLGRPWIHSQNAIASTLHQIVRWTKGKTVFTAYAEDRQAKPRWPSLPSPAYDIDVPMVHMMELECQMSQLHISKNPSTPILDGMHRLRRELRKHPRGLHRLVCAGYQPYKGLRRFNHGITEPITLPSQRSRKGLGFIKPRRKNKSTYLDKPIKFVKGMMSPAEYLEFAEISKQDQPSSLVNDPIEEINIGTPDQPKILQIGSSLSEEEKSILVSFLTNYQEAFAWTYEDMPGLDLTLVQHFLPLKEECKPVKQKLCKLDPRLMGQVKEGLEDLLRAGFI
ncbi:unnamed protein product [Victoria cruziana]